MTIEEARALGIPDGMYPAFSRMTPGEAKICRCEKCNAILAIHRDARWRFQEYMKTCIVCP